MSTNDTTTTQENHWVDIWTVERATGFLGKQHVEWILRQPCPLATAACRVTGAWMANDGDAYAAYRGLVAHLSRTTTNTTKE